MTLIYFLVILSDAHYQVVVPPLDSSPTPNMLGDVSALFYKQ
ncbi:hypothetical protein [Saliterribacillus persicus]|nr:hypothetical protein [Saliterribacillus persicus]